MTLRDYQVSALAHTRALYASGARSVVLVCPTGGGKTIMGASAVKSHLARSPEHRVLWLAHRKELVSQAAKSIAAITGESVQTVVEGKSSGDGRVCVASIDTIRNWGEMPNATLVVIDEAHHARAETWASLIGRFPNSWRLGLTATPQRSDGRGLGDVFERMRVSCTVRQLVSLGYLVPCRVFAPHEHLDGLASEPIDAYKKFCLGKKTVIFCNNVVQSKQVAKSFALHGIEARHVDGAMRATKKRDQRSEALDDFASGKALVVSNVAVLTEGWDEPSAECVILARSCSHAGLFLQMVGRVLRPHASKASATLVDLRGVVFKHGLPDSDREYSLTDDPISSGETLDALAQCKSCGAVYEWAPKCPACGFTSPPRVRRIKLTPAELIEKFSNDTDLQRQQYRQKLEEEARKNGYKRGWIEHRFRAKYG